MVQAHAGTKFLARPRAVGPDVLAKVKAIYLCSWMLLQNWM